MAARLSRSKTWLHIQDFELDAAARLGILPGIGAAKRALESLETALYNGFDRVSTISRRMLEHLWRKGVPAEKTVLFPNWVDEKRIYPAAGSEHLRLEWNIEPERTLVLYSGNMGRKQGLETLIECARLLCQETGIFFILCGEGAVRPLLEKQAQGLSNLRFSPLLPVERLNELLNSADIHVLLQRADAADLVMPSKLGGMLASGRPVIATALPGTELAQVIDQVGRLVPPEDPRALADAILQLASQPDKQSELGRKGRFFVEQNWSKSQVLSKFLLETHQLLGS
jgi:colanic acid biosynthesis glycosyl transferase WcaI